MARIHEDILGTIGDTPVVRINRLAPADREIYVKLEAFNPLGSIKDRLALGVIEAAERDGTLKPGQTVVEATSGNTGIGLAMVCAQKGYPLVVTMAENFSVERRKLLRFLGAKVVLTPASEKGTGMVAKAAELAEKHGWFLCRQFENEANADIHAETTGPEILEAFKGRRLDYWVSGFGTGGTLKGVARALKARRPEINVIVCEPDNSQILASGHPQHYAADGSPAQSHPNFRPHLMQGWSPDFISKLAGDAVADGLIDGFVPASGADALAYARALARQEGIFCGISGGATFAGAVEVAKQAPEGSVVLCMLPDTGERYLSTALFDDVSTEMTEDEIEISRSTPRFRFDAPSTPAKPSTPAANGAEASEAASNFVDEAIASSRGEVVMFALEWCEFCWSVRKFFEAMKIPYRTIDLDSIAFQKDDWGGDIRKALLKLVGSPTIPQVFAGGDYIGGCTETFDAFRQGELQRLLKKSCIAFDAAKSVDPYAFLPKWLHPR